MTRIFLLRHAKSSWDDPELADHDRPLATRGQRDSSRIAEHLRSESIVPALVLCSSAVRAVETLERISPGWDRQPEVSVEEGLYGASSGELLARLRELPEEVDSVMLINHQPAIQELALGLARGGAGLERAARKFPTAAIATLEFEGSWYELSPDGAELVDFVRPKELRD